MSNIFQMIYALTISALFVSVSFADKTNNLIVAHFQPAKTNYYLGEPITVYLVITNQSTNSFADLGFVGAEFTHCSDSGIAKKTSGFNDGDLPTVGTLTPLMRKGQLKKTYYINKLLELEKPGKYYVDCSIKLFDASDIESRRFKVFPQAGSTQDYLTIKRKESKKGSLGFYSAPSPSSASNGIMVKVHDQIAFALTKGSVEQLAAVFSELAEKTKAQDDNNTEAVEAALALSSVRSPIVVPYLTQAMMFPHPMAQPATVRALEEIGTPEAINGLTGIDVTALRNLFLKRDVAEALGRMKTKEGIPFLIKLLSDNDEETQIHAIQALGQIGGSQCMEAIHSKTVNFKDKVKDVANQVLQKEGVGDVSQTTTTNQTAAGDLQIPGSAKTNDLLELLEMRVNPDCLTTNPTNF